MPVGPGGDLAAAAPDGGAALARARPLDVDRAADQLGRGEIDAFIASPLISSQRVARIPLFSEGYLGMVAADHPRLGSVVSWGQLSVT